MSRSHLATGQRSFRSLLVGIRSIILQYGAGTRTPSWGSQMLKRTASMQPAAPGATAMCEGRTGVRGLKKLLK